MCMSVCVGGRREGGEEGGRCIMHTYTPIFPLLHVPNALPPSLKVPHTKFTPLSSSSQIRLLSPSHTHIFKLHKSCIKPSTIKHVY